MSEPLKPCPFCGHADVRTMPDLESGLCVVAWCKECGARTYTQPDEESAIAAWNARAVPPAPPSDEAVARALFKARGRHGEFFVGGPASNECLDDVRAVRAAEREAAR